MSLPTNQNQKMTTIATKQITWTLGNGTPAVAEITLTQDAAGYTNLVARAGLRDASTIFEPLHSDLPAGHPAIKAGATNGALPLVWTAERNAEIVAAYKALASHPAHIASQAKKAANIAAAAADTVNGDINKLVNA
jgi:hypothetical protein